MGTKLKIVTITHRTGVTANSIAALARLLALCLLTQILALAFPHDTHSIHAGSTSRYIVKNTSLSDEEKAWINEHKTVKVAFDAHFPPYSFINESGNLEGLAFDIVSAVAEQAGITIEAHPATWEELYEAAKKRDVDMVATMVNRPERKQWFTFTQPYIFKSLVIMTRDDYAGISSRKDLQGKRVALVKDYQYVKRIIKEFPSIVPYYVETTLDALIAVSTGKAQAAITHFGGGHYLRTKHLLTNLKFAAVYDKDSSLESIGVRKDWPELVSILDKTIQAMPEKELLALQRKWLPERFIHIANKIILTEEESEWIQSHHIIRLGIDPEFAPFEYISDRESYSGIASDYIKILNERLGLNMQVVKGITWKEAVEKAKAGDIDILPCVGITEERKTFLNYSDPYINFHRVIITRTDTPFLTGIDDIVKMKTAVQENTSHEGYIKDNTEISPFLYKTLQDALISVSSGETDAFVGNVASSTYWIRKMNLTNLKVAAPVLPGLQSLHFAIRKDWPELVGILNKGLASISPKEKTEIRQKWVAVDYKPGIDPVVVWTYILRISVISGIIMAVILIWNRRLKTEVGRRREAEKKLKEANEKLEDRVMERTAELEQTNNELRTINKITSACTGTLNLKEILDIVLDAALNVAGLEGGTICLVNPDNTFQLAAHRGTSQATINDLTDHSVKIGSCLCGNVAKDSKPLILWNSDEVNKYATREAQRGEKILFHAAYPITMKDNPLGVLCVFTRTESKPEKKNLKLLETMTSQISLAVENAQLYAETVKNAITLEKKVDDRTAEIASVNELLKKEVDEHKKAAQTLRESEAKFRELAGNINEIFWITSPDGTEIVYVSPAFEDIWGVTCEALYQNPHIWMDSIISEDRDSVVKAFTRDKLVSGEFDIEYRIVDAAGSIRWIHAIGFPTYNEDGDVYRISGIASDITKFKEIDRLKSMFIASMSHELRTPLNSIIGFTGMTLQGLSGDINEEQKDNLTRSYKAAKHLLNLITDVIDISKIEAGRVEIYPEKFTLGELAEEAVASIQPMLKDTELDFSVDVQPELSMHTDRKRLLQCLINLLSNAVKYTEQGSVCLATREVKGNIEISVRDTGIGIPEEDKPKLFEAFERLESHLQVKAGGTGLGLYLTRKLTAELLKGDISVKSRKNEGSTFTITIPRNINDA